MTTDALITPFLRVALFQGLKPLQITEIARNGERVLFCDGDTILKAHEEGDAAFLVVKGSAVRLSHMSRSQGNAEKPELLAFREGTLLGEMAMLIDGHYHGSTIVAAGSMQAIRLTRYALHSQMESDPELAAHLVEKIASRLATVARELRQIDQTLDPNANRSLADRLETRSAA